MPLRPFKQALSALSGIIVAVGLTVPDLRGEVSDLATIGFFSGPNGSTPYAGLLQGADGSLYGTTFAGGATAQGSVFKIPPGGALTNLYYLSNSGGSKPYAGLIQSPDGLLYGTTWGGGLNNLGTVFRLTTNGVFTTMASFANTNGSRPAAKLLLHPDGNFYGTTLQGGLNNMGTVFRMTSSGVLTTITSFNGVNGAMPYADLIRGADGSLYGTTINGGTGEWGTVFRVTTNGTLTTLLSFNGTNGANPYGGLVQDTNGVLYGTTTYGGTGFDGSVQGGFGTVYRITTNGVFQPLYLFAGGNDGWNPWARLIQTKDGNLYGTTILGGVNAYGTVFQITTNGALSTLLSFGFDENGISPYGELLAGPYNNLYGTTYSAGPGGDGTVFRVSPAPPQLQTSTVSNALLTFRWASLPGQSYQVQYRTNLNQVNWFNLGNSITATGSVQSASDSVTQGTNRFYRVVIVLSP